MSDRAGLTFTADINDEPAKMKLYELTRLGDNVNAQMQQINEFATESYTHNLGLINDMLMIMESVMQMMGIQLAGWQRLALSLVEQTAVAAMHALNIMVGTQPWMLPIYIRGQALLMTLQAVAYVDIQTKGAQAQEDWFRTQQALQMVIRF